MLFGVERLLVCKEVDKRRNPRAARLGFEGKQVLGAVGALGKAP